MKTRKYYTLLGQNDFRSPWEIIFGDYDRECVEQERDDDSALDTIKTKIICTNEDQKHIDDAVAKLNAKSNADITAHDLEAGGPFPFADDNAEDEEERAKWDALEKAKLPTLEDVVDLAGYHKEQSEIDKLSHVAQAYLVMWFSDLSTQVFNRNYQLISTDGEVATMTLQNKDEFKGDREMSYRSPNNGEIGEARWFHSDPDIIHFIKPSDELVRS